VVETWPSTEPLFDYLVGWRSHYGISDQAHRLHAGGAGAINNKLITAHVNLIGHPFSAFDLSLEYNGGSAQC
jgi:hypothetical protein